MFAFKLFRVRKDGSLGSLFINPKARIPTGKRLVAKKHVTKGFKVRPGWHCVAEPNAPHLSMKGREWRMVWIAGFTEHRRPAAQGGLWYTSKYMIVYDKHIFSINEHQETIYRGQRG